ncbi:hypothetical protein FACS189442_5070 [Spirochaetia bacterium]|nr:hypothetical protein FACS189442_5070 [Spirochaetia bacterium]
MLAVETYRALQEVRCLDPNNSARIGCYSGMLDFYRKKAEINTALKAAVAALDNTTSRISYNAEMTRGNNNVKAILAEFYTSPNITTYNKVRDIHAIYFDLRLGVIK